MDAVLHRKNDLHSLPPVLPHLTFYCMNKINYPEDICFTIRSIFTEMTSMNSLIVQSLNQVQKMVDADRASLFLIDTKTNQLYAK